MIGNISAWFEGVWFSVLFSGGWGLGIGFLVSGFWLWVSGLGFGVWGLGFGVPGLGFGFWVSGIESISAGERVSRKRERVS